MAGEREVIASERQTVLSSWLAANWELLGREHDLRREAAVALLATGEEIDWVADEWRRRRNERSEMTTTESPAVPAVRQSDPTLDRLARLGQWLAALEADGRDEKSRGAAAALRFYYAEQLDLPATAVAELTVIKGRLYVSAQLLRALAERSGYRVVRKAGDDTTCTAALLSPAGEELGTATFTIEQAQRAGLIRDSSAWKTHPGRMLWARASKNVIVDFAPGVALGIALDDEASEYSGQAVEEADWAPVVPEQEQATLDNLGEQLDAQEARPD